MFVSFVLLIASLAKTSTVSVPTARSLKQSHTLLNTVGAFALPTSTVDKHVVKSVDEWLISDVENLVDYPIRSPLHRRHRLLLPGDANGNVALAVAQITQALLGGALHPHAVLVELGAMIVGLGAGAQELHQDRVETGFLSCQLALHDTPLSAGALELAIPHEIIPGSSNRADQHTCATTDTRCHRGERTTVEVAPVRAGAVTCYDGRLYHRGGKHGNAKALARRILYFTAGLNHVDTDTNIISSTHALHADYDSSISSTPTVPTSAPSALVSPTPLLNWLGVTALHPRLRCAPLRNVKLLPLSAFCLNSTTLKHSTNQWWINTICGW